MDTNTRPSVVPWHAIPDKAVCRKLEVAPDTGLLQTEVAVRLQRHGPNRLAEKPPRPAWLKFLDQFRSVLIGILVSAALLAGLIGDINAT